MRLTRRSCFSIQAIVVSAATVLGSLSAIAAASPHTAHWVERGSFPSRGVSPNAVACPTASMCVMAGVIVGNGSAIARTTDGGATWQDAVITPTLSGLTTVSCGSTGFCVAAGGSPVLDIVVSTDGGSHWSLKSTYTTAYYHGEGYVPLLASCWSSADCVVMTASPTGVAEQLATTDGGTTWTATASASPLSGTTLTGLSCLASGSCEAIGFTSSGAAYAARSTDGAATWTSQSIPALPQEGSSDYGPLSCVNGGTCAALVGLSGGAEAVMITTTSGSTWSIKQLPTQGISSGVEGVVCAAAATCFTIGGRCAVGCGPDARWQGEIERTTDGGATWHELRLPARISHVLGMACGSATACVARAWAAGYSTEVLRVDVGSASPSLQPLSTGTFLNGVTCVTASHCIGAGSTETSGGVEASVTSTRNGGRHWVTVEPGGAAGSLSSVACPTKSRCLAIGYELTPQGSARVAVRTLDGGATWQLVPFATSPLDLAFGQVLSVACETASMCVTAGGASLYVTADFGARWTRITRPYGVRGLYGVACTDSMCLIMAADAGGPPAVLRSTDRGRTWTFTALHLPGAIRSLDAVTCPTSRRCVAAGTVLKEGTWAFAVSSDAGATWRATGAPRSIRIGSPPDTVSCLSPLYCLAANENDAQLIVRSVDGGVHWSPLAAPKDGGYLTDVSCGPSGCWIVSDTPIGAQLDAWR